MRSKLTRLSIPALATALILGACAQDSPTVPELTPGTASNSNHPALNDSVVVPVPPGVNDSTTLCLKLNSRVTLEETCVPIAWNVGTTKLKYAIEATPTTPTVTFLTCAGVPTDATVVQGRKFMIVFGDGIGGGSIISASIGTELQHTTVGPLSANETHGHVEDLSFELSSC